MTRSVKTILVLTTLAGVLARVALAQQGVETARPKVSVASGAGLKETVEALARATGGVAVAESARQKRKLVGRIQEAPLDEALRKVADDLDRFWVVRGTAVSLQLRYSDPDEGPGVEFEEVKAAAKDLDRLIGAVAPKFPGVSYTVAKEQFVASITPEQQRRMIDGGLPLAELPRAQRDAFLRISLSHAYDDTARELRRAALCLGNWERVRVEFGQSKVGNRWLSCRFPDREADTGVNGVMVRIPGAMRRTSYPRSEGLELPVLAERATRGLRPVWKLPPQEMDLASLAVALRKAGGPRLETPEYAAARKFWVCSVGATRRDVLTAVADMWGWELTLTRKGYRLARPRLRLAKGAVELHQRMRQAVPPAIWHSVVAVQRYHDTARWGRQMDLLLADAERVAGKNWRRLSPAKLSDENQRRLANLVLRGQVGAWYFGGGGRRGPRPYIVAPQQAVLHLSGPLGPDEHPLLKLLVPIGENTVAGWGWAVGTNTLRKSQQ